MQPSTGTEGATSVQNCRQGASEPWKVGAYGASTRQSTSRRSAGRADVTDARDPAALNTAARNNGGLALKGVRGPINPVTVLEPAGREEQLQRHGLHTGHRWSEAERRPRHSDELEPNEYDADDAGDGRGLEELGFLIDGGWTAVDTTRGTARNTGFTPGARDAGMTSHRGTLHSDEYVDHEALRPLVEDGLGFTYDDVHAVYRRGRLSASTLELRARIDARLLELANAGANVAQLGRVLGFSVNASGSCEALNNALERARKERNA